MAKQAKGKAGKVVKPTKAWSIVNGGRIQANWTTSVRRIAESAVLMLPGPPCEVIPVLIVPTKGYRVTPAPAKRRKK